VAWRIPNVNTYNGVRTLAIHRFGFSTNVDMKIGWNFNTTAFSSESSAVYSALVPINGGSVVAKSRTVLADY